VVEELTALVAKTVSESHEQIRAAEQFLAGLTDRLGELEAYMQRGSTLRDESLAGGRELDRVVRGQVRDIESRCSRPPSSTSCGWTSAGTSP